MKYEEIEGYKKPKTKVINKRLTLVIYQPVKAGDDVLVGLDHFSHEKPVFFKRKTIAEVFMELYS